MKEEVSKQDSSTLQDYLSLGYIYLLVLGIIVDAIRYGFLGVNIINYSTILDVLLSPIVYLTQNISRLGVLIAGVLISIGLTYGSKWLFEKYKHDESFRKRKNFASQEKMYANFQPLRQIFFYLGLFIFGLYIGFGVGGGVRLSKELKAGALEMDTQLVLMNNDTLNVKKIGHNSQYFFYAAENATQVTIMPIQNNIKTIKNLD